jgi:hypothetical protein
MSVASAYEMTRSRRWFWPLLFGGVAGSASLPRTARADEGDESAKSSASTKPALDLEYVVVEGKAFDSGVGGAFRLGREFDGPLLSLTPELGGSYHSLDGVYDASLYRGFAGLRLSLGLVVEPGIFGHVGYGHISFSDASPFDGSHGGLTYDAGLTLDFTLLPVLEFGAHAAYNGLTGSDGFERINWVSAGGHVSVRF